MRKLSLMCIVTTLSLTACAMNYDAEVRHPVQPVTVYRAKKAQDIQFYDAEGRALAFGCFPKSKFVCAPLGAASANVALEPVDVGYGDGVPVEDPAFWCEASQVEINEGSRVRVKKGGYAVSIPVPAIYDLKTTPDPRDTRKPGWPSPVFSQSMQRLWYDRDMKEIGRCNSRHLGESSAPTNTAYVRYLLPYNEYDNFNEIRLVRVHFGAKHPLCGKRNVKDSDLIRAVFPPAPLHPGEIVLEANPDCREKYAAAELVREVKTITGKTLPIVSAPTKGSAFRIWIGRRAAERAGYFSNAKLVEKLGDSDGYMVGRKGKDVYAFGATPRGTIFATMKLLEKVTDFFWWRPERDCGLSFTPRETIDFTTVKDFASKPVFKNRTYFAGCCPCNYSFDDWALHHGITRGYNPGAVFSADCYHAKCHGYFCVIGDNFLRLATHGNRDREEFWGYVNGKRQVGAIDGQPCYSNPEVVKATVANVNRILDERPEEWDAFEFAYSDSWQCCECAECLKPIKLPQGGELVCKDKMGKDSEFRSTRTYMVANEVAKTVTARFPDKPTEMLAYIYTAAPPAVKLHPSIRVLYATYASAVMRFPSKEQAGGTDNWQLRTQQWCEREPQAMGMYEYYFTCAPAMFAEVAAENLRQLADVGGTFRVHTEVSNDGPFTQEGKVGRRGHLFDVNSMDMVLIAELFWNPYRDVNKLREDFLHRVYGPGAKDMARFYELFARKWFDKSFTKWMNCHTPAPEIYVDYVIKAKIEDEMYACFDRALKKVTSPAAKKHLERMIATMREYRRATGRIDVPSVPELAKEWQDPRSPQWNKAFKLENFRDALPDTDDPEQMKCDLRKTPPALSKTKTRVDFACDKRYLYWRSAQDKNGGYVELRFTVGKFMEMHRFFSSGKSRLETGRIPMAAIRAHPAEPIRFVVRRFDGRGRMSFGRGADNKSRSYPGEGGASFSQLCPVEDSLFGPSDDRKLGIRAKPPMAFPDPELENHPLKKIFLSSAVSTGGQGMRRVRGVPVYDSGFGYCRIKGIDDVRPGEEFEVSGDRWCYDYYIPFVVTFLDDKGKKISSGNFVTKDQGPFKFRITCPSGTKAFGMSTYNSYVKDLKIERIPK